MNQPARSFWTFSLHFYAQDGVAETSLALQDQFDVDVNMLLFVLWAATRHRALSVADIRELIALVQPWRDGAVRPLRAARRFLKTTPWKAPETESLRKQVAAQELEAERLQQQFLEKQLDRFITSRAANLNDCAARNLDNYAMSIDAGLTEQQVATLLSALSKGFPTGV